MPMEIQGPEQHTPHQTASFHSSPVHEFSFNNVSLHSTPATSGAIDLTPADDIFFHGHLLPLHHLHSLPISPRSSSAASIDASSLPIPITNLISDYHNHTNSGACICIRCDHLKNRGHSFNSYEYYTSQRRNQEHNFVDTKPPSSPVRPKAKSFSLFGTARRRKQAEDQRFNRKKAGFDVMPHFLRKYVKLFSKGKTEDLHLINRAQSNDSTMEELQGAIQAAIAHCKDSIAAPQQKLQS